MDTKTWVEAARRYARLRRRYWRICLGGATLFLLFGMPLLALGERLNPVVRGIGMSLLAVVFVLFWFGSLATWLSLIRFRCPHCGNRFIMGWTGGWPTNRCKHCRFDLGPAAMANA